MQTLTSSLAVLAFIGVVLLLFANSALLKMVHELRDGLAEVRASTPNRQEQGHRSVPAFTNEAGEATYVVVVNGDCPMCEERARHLVAVSANHGGDRRLVALSSDVRCAAWFAGSEVEFIRDPALVGHIGVGVTPMLLRYGADGIEELRRVVASDADLERLLGLPAAPSADISNVNGGAR